MSKKVILVITGGTRCGKSTLAAMLKSMIEKSEIVTMGATLKKIVSTVIGISPDTLDAYKDSGRDLNIEDYNVTIRDLYNRTALYLRKTIKDSIFVDSAIKAVKESNSEVIIIPDLRFTVELDAIRGLNSDDYKIIYIKLNSNLKDCHYQDGIDNDLKDITYDYAVSNMKDDMSVLINKAYIIKKDVHNLINAA